MADSYCEEIDELARELIVFPEDEDCEEFTIFHAWPEQQPRLVHMLQTGLLDTLIEEIRARYHKSPETQYAGNDMYALLVLTAMHLGVKMKDEYIFNTRALSYRIHSAFHHLQTQTACNEYKNNGTPWVFENQNARNIANRTTGNVPPGVGNGVGYASPRATP